MVQEVILPDSFRFEKMCKTGSLGDYLGLPTFGTKSSKVYNFSDNPCNADSRSVSGSDIDEVMKSARSGSGIPGVSCSLTLDPSVSKTVSFVSKTSSTPVSSDIIQIGIDIAISGGDSAVFDGVQGYFVLLSNDHKYLFEVPITLKSEKGVLMAHISSVEASKFGSSYGTPLVLISAPDTADAIGFDNVKFSVVYTTYSLQSDVSYLTYPFATVYDTPQDSEITFNDFPFKSQKPGSASFPRLLAYRFRAYESVYNAYYRDIRNNPFVVAGRPVYNKWLPTMKGGADETLYELNH